MAWGSAHERPHAPQCAVLDCVLVSQPSAASPLQSPAPALQRTTVQAPAVQPVTAVPGSAHDVVQLPQRAGSTSVLAQKVDGDIPQVVSPPPQVAPHAPPEHTCPAVQAVPHAPQLPLSVRVFTSQPSDGLPLQSA